jgi:phage major head subunit gpT-like protein
MLTLKERNEKALKKAIETGETTNSLRESVKRKFGFDMLDEKAFPVADESFSWKAVKKKLELREADASSAFVQVLRAGVQTLVNQMYQSVPITYDQWVKVVNSSKAEELYAPLHGIGFPGEVAKQSTYPETGAAGLDIKLANRKYGEIFSVEMELLEDDQTGQFQEQVKLIAEYLKQIGEVVAYGKLNSVAGSSYAGLSVPVSETKPSYESSYPWSTSLRGGGATKGTAAVLSQANIQTGMIALMNQKNLLGLKMGVSPQKILLGPKYQFDIAVLMNSAFYPVGAASAGNTGGAFAINPIKGILDPVISRFMFDQNGVADGSSKAWYLVDSSKPAFVLQMREAAAVLQEAPNAGESFNRDVVRFKGMTRLNADFIDPRFFWQGSDGSV